jgi:hypothetical protein
MASPSMWPEDLLLGPVAELEGYRSMRHLIDHRIFGGPQDRPKPGRRPVVDEVGVVLATLEPPPERLGATDRLVGRRVPRRVPRGGVPLRNQGATSCGLT